MQRCLEEQHVSQFMKGLMGQTMRESSKPHEQGKKDMPVEGPASAQRGAKLYLTTVSIIFINYLSLAPYDRMFDNTGIHFCSGRSRITRSARLTWSERG